MKILLLFLFIPIVVSAQVTLTKNKGAVFNRTAKKPYQNLNIGYVFVTKTVYGLTFDDKYLSKETIKVVKTFFKQSLKGYCEFKKYRLKVEKRLDGLYIENLKLRKLCE